MTNQIKEAHQLQRSLFKFRNCVLPMILLIFSLQFAITACKKEKADAAEWNLSFTYNGQKYNLGRPETSESGSPLWPSGGALGAATEWLFGDDYLWINRPDIFNGIIKFKGSSCTFFSSVPTNNPDLRALFDRCQANINGQPIDSNTIYFYKSGFATGRSENCTTKWVQEWGSSGSVARTTCDYYGNFSLQLVNKQGKTIKLTNGEYKHLRVTH